jgi:hypothetical protein
LPGAWETDNIDAMSAYTSIWVPFGAFMAISFAAHFAVGVFQTRRRTRNVTAVAQELGFAFTPWIGPMMAPRFATELFRNVMGGTFKNVLTGHYAGMDVQLFDYSCTTGNPGNTSTAVQTVAVYTQNFDLPLFTLQPRNLALEIMVALQHQKVDLDYPPGVSRHYAASGPEREKIRTLFNGNLLSFVEGLDRSQGWHIEGAGKTLVLYRYRRRVAPTELKDFLLETSSIAQSFFAFSGQKAG